MSIADSFAQSYAEARQRFLDAADAAGLDVTSHAHPMVGPEGETLALDVARDGPADASAVLILSSGCHGVEGYCGSGVQVALLRDAAWLDAARSAGVAVLYLHALNPYGFAWTRRVTHENVDLNRNFIDFTKPPPQNPAYCRLARLLVPATWPPTPANEAALQKAGAAMGALQAQQAVSGGQYEHPEGLFYGGHDPTWSHIVLRRVLREHGRRCARLGWIDVHTGLGPEGVGERIFSCRDDAAALSRARRWWGDSVTSLHDGSSSSSPLTGQMWTAAYDECAQAEYTGIALEFGTLPIDGMIGALRAEQWLDNHPEAPEAQRMLIRRQMRDAFYIDTADWKRSVVEQAFDAARRAVTGLTARS